MNNAIEVKSLTTTIGNFALQDINLQLPKGTIMGLIGKNGAGKTTFIKSILNIIARSKGEVLFDGLPLFGNEDMIQGRIGVVFDSHIYPLGIKPRKLKSIVAPLYDTFDENKFDTLLESLELDPNKRLSAYSKGMQMKFSIAMALSHNPDLLILDEPTAGLDPVARTQILEMLLELIQDENKSVLFSTHITSDLEKIADYLTVIDNGRILVSQGKDELLDEYVLIQANEESLTKQLKANVIGIRRTAFGFTGLLPKAKSVPGIKSARPSIDDILTHFSEEGRKC